MRTGCSGHPGTEPGTAAISAFPEIDASSPPADQGAPPPSAPGSAVDDAFAVGDGPIDVELWVDYFCPYCGAFEATNGDFLQQLVDGHQATLHIHPIAILDRASMGTRYSTRSANAAACVAEYAPADYFAYHRLLYAIQPAEGTEGLPDAQLAGEAPVAARDCITGEWFDGWVDDATQRAVDAGVTGTPTVIVDGDQYSSRSSGTPFGDFKAFVLGRSAVA